MSLNLDYEGVSYLYNIKKTSFRAFMPFYEDDLNDQ